MFFVSSIMSKSPRLGNGSAHCNRSRIGRPRERASPAPSPTGESVTNGGLRSDRDSRSTVLPATGGAHRPSRAGTHRQVILCGEVRCVSFVGGGSYSV